MGAMQPEQARADCLQEWALAEPRAGASTCDEGLWWIALAAKADADLRIGPEEADVLAAVRIDSAIHCAEEFVGAIAEADLGVGIAHRKAGKGSEIGDCGLLRPSDCPTGVIDDMTAVVTACRVTLGGLVLDIGGPSAEENCAIAAPIERDLTVV